MDEHLLRALKHVLDKNFPHYCELLSELEPKLALPPHKKIYCCESVQIGRDYLPFFQLFSPGESEFGYSLSWTMNSEAPEHTYRFYIDFWISGSDPETLYFQLLRYKSAIYLTLRDNINLGGLAIGGVVRNVSYSNLMGTGNSVVQSMRLNLDVLAPAFLQYPKVGCYE